MAPSTASARKAKPVPSKRDADGWVRKGLRYDKTNDEKKAMQCYLAAFNEDPRNLNALKLLSRKLIRLTERRLAIEILEQALKANPGDGEVYVILGNLALEMRMHDAALDLYKLVCQLKPAEPTGPNNVATVLREMERFDEAVSLLQEAIPQHPSAAILWNTLATVVSARDGIDEAMPFYEEALRLDPKMGNAWGNLARVYSHAGRYEDAVKAGREAVACDPELTEPRFSMATALLALGRLEEGWEEYEWRQHWRRPLSIRYLLQCPRWDGESLGGRSLVVCPEQGVGDEVMFATCIPDVAEQAGQLYIGCDHRLVSLYQRSFPDAVVGGYRDVFHNAQRCRDLPFLRENGFQPDHYIEVGSLFKFTRRTISDFPDRTDGYLIPDPERVAHWRQELAAAGPGLKVGIGWESRHRNNDRDKHYTSLEQWGDILGVEGVTFVNLQYTDCEDQLAQAEQTHNVTIHRPRDINLKDDLDDLAALIRALDIVICPTIAVAGMTLAVGTELWLLARIPPFWHFGNSAAGDSTPLGPSRLFLHDEQGGWETPTRDLSKALRERA